MAAIRLSRIRTEERTLTGVSLEGPSSIIKGTTAVFTITDYDVFSIYLATASVGTAIIDRDEITLSIPSTAIASQTTLNISMNGVVRSLTVSLEAGNIIAQPEITSPVTDTTGVSTNLTLQGSSFVSLPAGVLTHTASEWMIARDAGFTDIVTRSVVSSGNLTSFTVSLATNTKYYARMRYISNSVTSEWTPVITFTTTTIYIQKPVVSSQNGKTTNINVDTTFIGSTFEAVPAGTDTHISSTWIVRNKTDNSIAYQVDNSTTSKLSVVIPTSGLKTSSSYSIELKYSGQVSQSSFSDELEFTTANEFIPSTPGEPFQGGYYVGRYKLGGAIYALIVAPKAGGEGYEQYSYENLAGPYGLNDGAANTSELIRAAELFPIGKWVKGLSIGGYRDWYIPSVDELELCYRKLKPTGASNYVGAGGPRGNMGYNPSSVPAGPAYTSNSPSASVSALFRSGGSQAFQYGKPYWTSSFASVSTWGRAFTQDFASGLQESKNEIETLPVRAVRKVRIN